MSRRSKIAMIVLLVFAFAARAGFTGLVVGWSTPPKGDDIDYYELASSLAAGDGYAVRGGQPTARRPFFYPAFLAAVFKLTGPSVAVAKLVQVLLGTLIVWMIFIVGRRHFSERAAWIAACLVAANPFLIFISAYMLTENLYIVLLLLLALIMPRPDAPLASFKRLVLLGLTVGVACLARPTTLGVALWIIASFWLLSSAGWRRKAVGTAVVAGMAVLILLPWAARNKSVFGKWMFFTSHGGITFYQGNNAVVLEVPNYYGGVAPLDALPGIDKLRTLSTVEKDSAAYAMGLDFLRHNKRHIPILLARKFQRFWRLRSDVGLSGIRSGWWFGKDSALGRIAANFDVGFIYAVVVIPLFVAGLILGLRRFRELSLLYGLVIVHSAYPLVFHGSIRMRIPIETVIALSAAAVVAALLDRVQARSLRRRQSSAQIPR